MNGLLGLMNLFSLSDDVSGGAVAGYSPGISATPPVSSTAAQPKAASMSKLGQAYLALNGLSTLSTLAGGFASFQANRSEAARLNEQAEITLEQARRDAILTAQSVKSFREQQASGYLNSGVTLEGSPMEVLTSTLIKGQQEINAISKQGQAQARLFRLQAGQTQRQGAFGLAASGLTGGVNYGKALIQAKRLGVFGNSSPTLQGGQ